MTSLAAYVLAFLIGGYLGHRWTRASAAWGLKQPDVITRVLDGLALTQLNKLRDAVDKEIKTRLEQAEEERA